ncbi:polygalacturonase QRT3-like isoform X2 [Nymphaea colorata]|uniref:polygalacturonase QRT3-like isoform X2 n=1 Tax=Nymphaea colorata TaxID=210225 RepID=UPI00129E90C6|nr:polygalacturonase QRT3-like isoform X2 [Nymphaea colorata]
MAARHAFVALLALTASLLLPESGQKWWVTGVSGGSDHLPLGESHFLKTSLVRRKLIGISPSSQLQQKPARVFHVTAYGADSSGKTDSTDALMKAIADAFQAADAHVLMQGIPDLGGSEIHLDGGVYLISRPLRFPSSGGGNLLVHGGSLRASDDFPADGYLIELQPSSSSYAFEDITFKDLMLDANYRGGGMSIVNSLRTTIDNCYVSHFMSDGILVKGGHETYIHNSFLGQHITAGGDPGEKSFSGTGINLMGNDNAVTDVVIFSAQTGILISGQANIITGVHCYNKATGWGGTGIYVQSPGLSQTRIVDCYLDYTGIVAEDPVQLHISNSFFLGNAFVLLKSVAGVVNGLNIVDNMFSGDGKALDIVQLDQSKTAFTSIDQVVIDRNNARGMNLRSTAAKGVANGNGTSTWTVDFSSVLLFPDLIRHVQYALYTPGVFPNHALRNVSRNSVTVGADTPVSASVFVSVDQNTLPIAS